MENDKRTPDEMFTKAVEAYQAGNFAESVDWFTKVLVVHSSDAVVLNNRALALREAGKYHEGLEDINAAILIDPHKSLYYSTKATILTKLHRQLEAIEELDKAIAIEPLEEYVVNRVVILKKLNRYQDALAGIDWIERSGHGSDAISWYKGCILFDIRKLSEAKIVLESIKNPEIKKVCKPFLDAINSLQNLK